MTDATLGNDNATGLTKRETFAAQFTAAMIIATNTEPKDVQRGPWGLSLVAAGLVLADAQIAGLNGDLDDH